ncbi:MAG: lysine exporter LysO family protein [Anaerovoracaceae bacterium]
MTIGIVVSVVLGVLFGRFLMPEVFYLVSGDLLIVGLCVLLFFVGIDLGRDGTVVASFKKVGARILVFPFAIILGTLVSAFLISLVLPITARESMAVSAGLGWYTLAPIILSEYSAEISALSFMYNVMRELFGIMLIPFVAKYIGFIECVGLPGSASMDVCLPIVERATSPNITIYSFVSGVVMSISVPILVPLLIGL